MRYVCDLYPTKSQCPECAIHFPIFLLSFKFFLLIFLKFCLSHGNRNGNSNDKTKRSVVMIELYWDSYPSDTQFGGMNAKKEL